MTIDKTSGGKNISCGYAYYHCPPWWHWEKRPKKHCDFNDISNYFLGASNYYCGVSDNCMHFAYSIWKKIK